MRTSHGGTPTRKNSSSSSPSFPAYLYRHGDIFYFRLRIPTGKQGKDVPSELRISLRTSYVRKANSLRDISIPSFKSFYNVVWTIRLFVSASMGSFVFFWKKATGKLILLWFRRNDKQVKNKNAVRIVPMYNKLIEIGFIEYVDSVNRKGEERVFLN